MKTKCIKCKSAMAAWCYMPNANYGELCDNCVPRGCSCNIKDEETGEMYLDEQGRELPCCEYDYSALGFFEEDLEEITSTVHGVWNRLKELGYEV